MDATELIEEAGRVAAQAAKQSALDLYYSPCTCSAPPRGHTTRQHDYRRLQVDELRAVLDVVERLAAALKASEERATAAELDAASLRAAWKIADRTSLTAECQAHAKTSFDLLGVAKERDALAAANLAANKRIVELEHERDAALLAAQGARRTAFNAEQKAKALDAVQRDTIARLEAQVKELRAELARLTTPRPIVEAPTDRPVLGIWIDHRGNKCVEVLRWDGRWRGALGTPLYREAEYLPLPEVKP